MGTVLRCRNCGAELVQVLVDLGYMPLANSYRTVDQLSEPEVTYPLRPMVCDSCYLVQVPAYAEPDDVFRDYAYFSGQSQTWVAHCCDMMMTLRERFTPGRVLEIASNDGTFLRQWRRPNIEVLGVEPARNVAWQAQLDGIPTIDEFFGVDLATRLVESNYWPDLIVANNVLAHVPDLDDFINGVRTLLPDDGVAVFEFPHLSRIIEDDLWDTIYHEHFSYFSLHSAMDALSRRDMRVFDVEKQPVHGGSLRVYTCHADAPRQTTASVFEVCAEEAPTLGLYADYYRSPPREKCAAIKSIIDAASKGGIAAYGAAAKLGTFLNYCGIGPELIPFVVDSTPEKIGTYMPGSHIPIFDPDLLDTYRPRTILVGPYNWYDEICAKIERDCPWEPQVISRPFWHRP